MTKDTLWAAYAARNPAFNGPGNVTLSAAGLRKLFDDTWTRAEAHGREADSAGAKLKGIIDEIFNGNGGTK